MLIQAHPELGTKGRKYVARFFLKVRHLRTHQGFGRG